LGQSEPLSCRLQQRSGDLLFNTSHANSVSSMTCSSKTQVRTETHSSKCLIGNACYGNAMTDPRRGGRKVRYCAGIGC
jgi:hypothetical protein